MGETTYRVSCRGTIDDGARSRIGLEFAPGAWTGGMLDPGQPFPSVPQPFQFLIAAESEDEAIQSVREIVEGAGGQVDGFEAEPTSDG